MNGIAFVPAMLLIALACGCGPRNIYDSLRFYQEMGCDKLQGADRDECSRRSGMSYDEYERRLKAVSVFPILCIVAFSRNCDFQRAYCYKKDRCRK
jgi:hypothetical protein